MAYISEKSEPGIALGRLVALDKRIIIDGWDPKYPKALWYCDVCRGHFAVTAQIARAEFTEDGRAVFVTVCRECLQRAINGIDHSIANPEDSDALVKCNNASRVDSVLAVDKDAQRPTSRSSPEDLTPQEVTPRLRADAGERERDADAVLGKALRDVLAEVRRVGDWSLNIRVFLGRPDCEVTGQTPGYVHRRSDATAALQAALAASTPPAPAPHSTETP